MSPPMPDDQQDELPLTAAVSAPPAGVPAEGREDAEQLLAAILAQWRETDAAAAERGGWARVELYPHGAQDAQLAQRLHDEGLVYAINRLVLHPLGIALGVQGKISDGNPWQMETTSGLSLQTTDDPDGIEYEPADAAMVRNVGKLRRAGHDELADRIEAL